VRIDLLQAAEGRKVQESPRAGAGNSQTLLGRESEVVQIEHSILTIAGLIVGFIVILVSIFGIHSNGVVYGIVGGVVLILIVSIPCILIGLMVFRGFKNKASSRTVIIVAAAFFGIVGGLVVVGALALSIAVWYFTTHCC
jgi:hypothetical protein